MGAQLDNSSPPCQPWNLLPIRFFSHTLLRLYELGVHLSFVFIMLLYFMLASWYLSLVSLWWKAFVR